MNDSAMNEKSVLGFLSVLEDEQHGLFGGYLLLSAAGRPLEFHCTAPIRPNRAQQILYGPTLEAFLYGEQIGKALLTKSKTRPAVVCTDKTPALAVREHVSMPVALVVAEDTVVAEDPTEESVHVADTNSHHGRETERTWRHDGPHEAGPEMIGFRLGRNRLAVPNYLADDRREILDRLGTLDDTFDLAEPFGRIREAIREAQKAVR